MFMLGLIGLLIIIMGIQLKRGKWYGIIAGNTLKDKPMEVKKKGAQGASNIAFIVGGFLIIVYIFILLNINIRPVIIIFLISVCLFSAYSIYRYLKYFLKYGE